MRTFSKTFLLILFAVALSTSGCKVFKKDCDCPSFKNKKAQHQQIDQEYEDHAHLTSISQDQEND